MNLLFTSILMCCVGMSVCYSHRRIKFHIPKQASQSYSRNKRQAADQLQCAIFESVSQCNSGYNQGLIDVFTQCGQNDLAVITANGCARNEVDQLCNQKFLESINSVTEVQSSCQPDVGGTSNCSSECSLALETIQGQMGCCINAVLNVTASSGARENNVIREYLDQVSQYFSSTFWNRCGVETVGICPNVPVVTPGTQNPPCNFTQLAQLVLAYSCTQKNIQPLFNAIVQNISCKSIVDDLVNMCSQRSKGDFCSVYYITNRKAILSGSLVAATCNDSHSCSPNCKTSIEQLRNDAGCCLNYLYNSSRFQTSIASYELWNQCNVSSPGFCPSSVSAGSGKNEAGLFMVLAMFMTALKFLYR